MGRVHGGRHGGDIAHADRRAERDIRLMTLYGYSRLVGYDEKLVLQPDILERYDIVEDSDLHLQIREGHKWSDGRPFTAEDFRYAWEDIQLTTRTCRRADSPHIFWPTASRRLRDHRPLTVRYSWELPNPDFLPRIAAASL